MTASALTLGCCGVGCGVGTGATAVPSGVVAASTASLVRLCGIIICYINIFLAYRDLWCGNLGVVELHA